MSLYINPPSESKEAFLRREGIVVPALTTQLPAGRVLVVLLDNGMFTAASIPEGKIDIDDLANPHDTRGRIYYSVPKDKVRPILNRRDQERLDQIQL